MSRQTSTAPTRVANAYAAVQANMVNRGLVPEVDSSSLLQKLLSTTQDLRVACRVSYAFKINDDKINGWKRSSMSSVLKSVHVTPEVKDKFAAVYDEAVDQMRKVLEETYDRSMAELSHRIDTFEKDLMAQAAESQAAITGQIEEKYYLERMELEGSMSALREENSHQKGRVIYLEKRLQDLEASPDRGDIVLCNQLREQVVKLEIALKNEQVKCTEMEYQLGQAKKLSGRLESDISLIRAKFEMTKGMYARETSQLCDIIRMNETQFMQVKLAGQVRPQSPTKEIQNKSSSPRKKIQNSQGLIELYEPNSGKTIVYTSSGDKNFSPTKSPHRVQFTSHSSALPPTRPSTSVPESKKSEFPSAVVPTPTGSIQRPYI